jgi:hypothetical protein
MLNQKQFGCLKFWSVKYNWKFKKQKFYLFAKQKFPRQINDIRDTGPDTENTDRGPDMGFADRLSTNQNREFWKAI